LLHKNGVITLAGHIKVNQRHQKHETKCPQLGLNGGTKRRQKLMANQSPFHLYYTAKLPSRSVPIAYLSTPAATPAQLTSVNNALEIPNQGTLTVRQESGSSTFTAPDLNVPITVSGDTTYIVGNQFLEMTDQADNEEPLFYAHLLPAGVANVTILDANGNQETDFVIRSISRDGVVGVYLLHNFDAAPRQVRYVGNNGYVYTQLLYHTPVIRWSPIAATSQTYTLVGGVMNVETIGVYYVRFTAVSGYQVIPPYNDLPNVPWYARVRFGLNPIAPEWANQNWLPFRPYILGTWISGNVASSNLITFERAPI